MNMSKSILTAAAVFALTLTTTFAHAETYTWSFAGTSISGSGTLTATPYENPGEYLITGGTGTVITTSDGTVSVSFLPCATPDATCTLVNSDNAGANLGYDNLLFPNNPSGSQLDADGFVLTPGPAGTNGIGVSDYPSSYFYNYSDDGYNDLTTPFTVTLVPAAVSATPEPSSLVLLGSGLASLGAAIKRRRKA